MKLRYLDPGCIDLSDFKSLGTFIEDEDPPDAQKIMPMLIGFLRATQLPGERAEDRST